MPGNAFGITLAGSSTWAVVKIIKDLTAMSGELTVAGAGCDGLAPPVTRPDESLPWYEVFGIELALFMATLAPLIFGAILAR